MVAIYINGTFENEYEIYICCLDKRTKCQLYILFHLPFTHVVIFSF